MTITRRNAAGETSILLDTSLNLNIFKSKGERIVGLSIVLLILAAAMIAYQVVPAPVSVQPVVVHSPVNPVPRTALDSSWARIEALRMEIARMQGEYTAARTRFYRELAIKEAPRGGSFNWHVLYGLWMQESGLNHESKGDGSKDKAGNIVPNSWKAFGLGNVHVSTAKKQYGAGITKEDLLDPQLGGAVSRKVLEDYTKMFHGNLIYGIAAYQQGPGVTKWEYDRGVMPTNLKYVARVLAYAAMAE